MVATNKNKRKREEKDEGSNNQQSSTKRPVRKAVGDGLNLAGMDATRADESEDKDYMNDEGGDTDAGSATYDSDNK